MIINKYICVSYFSINFRGIALKNHAFSYFLDIAIMLNTFVFLHMYQTLKTLKLIGQCIVVRLIIFACL